MQQTTKYVIKADGTKSEVSDEKLKARLESLCNDDLNRDYLDL